MHLYQKGQCKEAYSWESGFPHSATVVHFPKKAFSAGDVLWSYFGHLSMSVLCWGYLVRGAKCRGDKENRKDRESVYYRRQGAWWNTGVMVTWGNACSFFSRNLPNFPQYLWRPLANICLRKAGNLSAPSAQLLHIPDLLLVQLQGWTTKVSPECHQHVVGQTAVANWLLQGQNHQLLKG